MALPAVVVVLLSGAGNRRNTITAIQQAAMLRNRLTRMLIVRSSSSIFSSIGALMSTMLASYFINKLAKKILYLEDKKVHEYLGNYDDYKEKLEEYLNE